MKNRLFISIAGVLIALTLLVAVNVLAGVSLAGFRADLTANKLFTLSEGSRRILENLEEPITLRFFRSKELSSKYVAAYSQRVEELLVEYKNLSGGKITLEVLDPEPFSKTEDKCVQYGIQPVPVPEGSLYFGLAGSNSIEEDKSMPFLDPSREEFLEYDLTKLIYTLSNPSKPVVGVLSSLPIEGAPQNPMMRTQGPPPWYIMEAIRELNYETRSIQPNVAEIPSDVTLLLVVHPKNLPEPTQYALDQFVLRGGKAIVFVDPWCEADEPLQDPNNPLQAMMAPRSSELKRLFDAWGIQSPTDKFVGDRRNATTVTYNNNGRPDQASFVAWIRISPEDLAKGEVTTSDMSLPLFFKEPGFLEHKEGATTTFTPLIETSEESMEIENSKIQFQANPGELLQNFFPSGKRYTLAARIGGKAKSAFPEGKPAAGEGGAESSAPHLAESTADISVVVVADADMLTDGAWVQVQNFGGLRLPRKLSENGTFVMNTLDFMQGSTDLISLRARGVSAHPFLVVEELKRDAEQRFRDEEGRLVEEKQRVERELNELISKKGDATEEVLMSADVQAKVEDLRKTLVATQERLRDVRYNLNKDVAALGTRLKLLNIGLIPLLTMGLALFVTVYRTNRRKSA
jgi:ABC-type uncharacterized transport system involved in gliding motility auxiliary subunit